MFRIVNPGKKVTKVSFAECLGRSQFAVMRDPSAALTVSETGAKLPSYNQRVRMEMTQENGMKVGQVYDLLGENYIMVEAFSAESEIGSHPIEYLIRVDFYDEDDN